eukprot:1366058-Amorphochlora_amoeboformis.AAC.1
MRWRAEKREGVREEKRGEKRREERRDEKRERREENLLGFLRQILIHPCTTHLALSLPSVIYHITLALLPISKDKKQYAKEKSEISTVHAEAEKRARRGARFLLEALGPAPGQVIEGLNRVGFYQCCGIVYV